MFNRKAYQYLQQLLEVAGDESVIFMKRPATLLGVVPVTGEVAEDHLQPLFIVTHLALWQRCTQVLQGRIRNISTHLCLFNPLQRTHRLTQVHSKGQTKQHFCFLFSGRLELYFRSPSFRSHVFSPWRKKNIYFLIVSLHLKPSKEKPPSSFWSETHEQRIYWNVLTKNTQIKTIPHCAVKQRKQSLLHISKQLLVMSSLNIKTFIRAALKEKTRGFSWCLC